MPKTLWCSRIPSTQSDVLWQTVCQGGGNPSRKLLVQFTEEGYEDSAWIKEKFVPRRFVEEFEQRQDQEDPPELQD